MSDRPAKGEAVLRPLESELEYRFADFFGRHHARAQRIAWRLVGGDYAAADDVVQNAFLKAYRALDSYEERQQFDAWFYRILVREASNYRRWRGLRSFWDVSSDTDRADPTPVEQGDPALRQRLRVALESISSRQQQAFVLVHLEGFTVAEAAQVMGRATGTVKSHLQRALVALREQLKDLRETGE